MTASRTGNATSAATTAEARTPTDDVGLSVDALVDPYVGAALSSLDGAAPLLARMARYHLGEIEADGSPAPDSVRRLSQGKRLRPAVALHCCAAAGGEPTAAAPVAAAIELLHNFTLIHDDIQDESQQRRHRPTVWAIWGRGQAINAGDALFAAAHSALYRVRETGASTDLTLRIADAFARMTIEIVEGQVLDLDFEGRANVTPSAYLAMIAGKTAAIVRFAAWSGALLGGADERRAERFGAFGRALGLGFQVKDDLLGIWGVPEVTGKAAADDIRRRKQSLPILLLRDRANAGERAELDEILAAPSVPEPGVAHVLALLDRHGVRTAVEERVAEFHDQARAALQAALPADDTSAHRALLALTAKMANRDR